MGTPLAGDAQNVSGCAPSGPGFLTCPPSLRSRAPVQTDTAFTQSEDRKNKISTMETILVKGQMMGAICFFLITSYIHAHPVSELNLDGELGDLLSWRRNPEKRTDIFVTRGWGAGGMPFNVLYTQTPKLGRATGIRPIVAPVPLPLSAASSYLAEPQALRSPRQEPMPIKYSGVRRQYSVIPQLFVSYGWGPLGRK